jgi:hypothetical protein
MSKALFLVRGGRAPIATRYGLRFVTTSPMSSSLEHVVPHVNVLSPHRRSGNRWLGLPLPKSADCVEEAEVPLLKDAKYACEKNDLSRFRR